MVLEYCNVAEDEVNIPKNQSDNEYDGYQLEVGGRVPVASERAISRLKGGNKADALFFL
jgi:hypothetical protein